MGPLPHPPVLTSDPTILLAQSQETLTVQSTGFTLSLLSLIHVCVHVCGGLCNGAPRATVCNHDHHRDPRRRHPSRLPTLGLWSHAHVLSFPIPKAQLCFHL